MVFWESAYTGSRHLLRATARRSWLPSPPSYWLTQLPFTGRWERAWSGRSRRLGARRAAQGTRGGSVCSPGSAVRAPRQGHLGRRGGEEGGSSRLVVGRAVEERGASAGPPHDLQGPALRSCGPHGGRWRGPPPPTPTRPDGSRRPR